MMVSKILLYIILDRNRELTDMPSEPEMEKSHISHPVRSPHELEILLEYFLRFLENLLADVSVAFWLTTSQGGEEKYWHKLSFLRPVGTQPGCPLIQPFKSCAYWLELGPINFGMWCNSEQFSTCTCFWKYEIEGDVRVRRLKDNWHFSHPEPYHYYSRSDGLDHWINAQHSDGTRLSNQTLGHGHRRCCPSSRYVLIYQLLEIPINRKSDNCWMKPKAIFGMNLKTDLEDAPYAFVLVVAISAFACTSGFAYGCTVLNRTLQGTCSNLPRYPLGGSTTVAIQQQ